MAVIDLKKITARIATAVMESLDKDVSLWADEMEQKYPEWKGSRIKKRSGNQYQRKLTFGYDNEQAAELEAGVPAKPVGRYVQQVKSHERKLGSPQQSNVVMKKPQQSNVVMKKVLGKFKKRRRVNVQAHKRNYKNHKPIQLSNGQWIMVSKIPKRKATKPVSKSAKKRYTGKALEKLIADAVKQEFK